MDDDFMEIVADSSPEEIDALIGDWMEVWECTELVVEQARERRLLRDHVKSRILRDACEHSVPGREAAFDLIWPETL